MARHNQSSYGSDKLEFRQIVLSHIKRILDISSHELRDTTTTRSHGNFNETIECEDTRRSYIQSIENLSYVLLPYFDDDMSKIYDECIEMITLFSYEIKKKLKEDYDKIVSEVSKDDVSANWITEVRIKYAKKMFVGLNQLLHRNDYLKSSIYGDSGVDEIVTDEEGEAEEDE